MIRARDQGETTMLRPHPARVATAGILALAGLALAGCAGGPRPAHDGTSASARSKDVVLAVAWPWAARADIRFGEGLQMAVDEINAGGGVLGRPLRLKRFDDRESVTEGQVVANEIARDREVVAAIGHLQSYVTLPASPIYDEAGIVLLAPAITDPALTTRGYGRVFRTIYTDATLGERLADFAAQRQLRRVAIYYIRNTYGRGLANAFERRAAEVGLSVVARQSYDPSEGATGRTFESTLAEWKLLEFDAILVAGEVPSGALLVAEARRAGLTVPILGGDAMGSQALLSLAGPAAEGTIVASIFHPDEPRPEVRKFSANFERLHGARPDAGAALGYDAVRLLAHAITRAGSTAPAAVAQSLHGVRDWAGVTGGFTFTTSGDLVRRDPVMMVVRNGRFEYLSEPLMARRDAPEPGVHP